MLQEKFKNSQKQVNVFTKLPIGTTQIQSVSPNQSLQEAPKAPAALNCSHCALKITFRPELIQIKVTCLRRSMCFIMRGFFECSSFPKSD